MARMKRCSPHMLDDTHMSSYTALRSHAKHLVDPFIIRHENVIVDSAPCAFVKTCSSCSRPIISCVTSEVLRALGAGE
eukprot:2189166-Amphidinium_carterae.2